MGELIPFPLPKKQTKTESFTKDISNASESNILTFEKRFNVQNQRNPVQAYFLEGSPKIIIGSEVIIKVFGKKYKGSVIDIIKKDKNNNVTKIMYSIPFLSGDDPLKFGEADFKYIVESYD
jgi:hypothetical protein